MTTKDIEVVLIKLRAKNEAIESVYRDLETEFFSNSTKENKENLDAVRLALDESNKELISFLYTEWEQRTLIPKSNKTISEDIQHVGYDAEQCGRNK